MYPLHRQFSSVAILVSKKDALSFSFIIMEPAASPQAGKAIYPIVLSSSSSSSGYYLKAYASDSLFLRTSVSRFNTFGGSIEAFSRKITCCCFNELFTIGRKSLNNLIKFRASLALWEKTLTIPIRKSKIDRNRRIGRELELKGSRTNSKQKNIQDLYGFKVQKMVAQPYNI